MINTYIEQAIQNIETARDKKIAEVRDTVLREKIAPKNAEIDTARELALQELQTKLNTDIATLQEVFAKERQLIIDASEKQKTSNANMLVIAETASIAVEYDEKISALKKLIGV